MFHQFFFFKQKTSYEMRISDWSSDVCSSDLPRNKSGVTVGGGLLAFLPRLLRIRREQVPEIIALVPKRRGVAVGHRAGDAVISLGAARAGLPTDLPRKIGRATVSTPAHNAHLVCRIMTAQTKKYNQY